MDKKNDIFAGNESTISMKPPALESEQVLTQRMHASDFSDLQAELDVLDMDFDIDIHPQTQDINPRAHQDLDTLILNQGEDQAKHDTFEENYGLATAAAPLMVTSGAENKPKTNDSAPFQGKSQTSNRQINEADNIAEVEPIAQKTDLKHQLVAALLGLCLGGGIGWLAFDQTSKLNELATQFQSATMQMQSLRENLTIEQAKTAKLLEELKEQASTMPKPAPTFADDIEDGRRDRITMPSVEPEALQEVAGIDKARPFTPITPQTPVILSNPQPTASPNVVQQEKPLTKQDKSWVVNITSEVSQAAALQRQQQLLSLGIRSVLSQASVHGREWYRVQVDGFATKEQAKDYLQNITSTVVIQGMWVSQ